MAREIIRSIQQLRKDSGFEITDRIIVTLPDTEETRSCLDANYDYVASQVLATEVRFAGDAIAVEKV
jgi:isoleucyl-tRNA synthetase